jgi:hypothetical protein
MSLVRQQTGSTQLISHCTLRDPIISYGIGLMVNGLSKLYDVIKPSLIDQLVYRLIYQL